MSGAISKLGIGLIVATGALMLGGPAGVDGSSFDPVSTVSLGSAAPGANASISTNFTLNAQDAMFEVLIYFIPGEFGVAGGESVTDGALVGNVTSTMTLGLIGSACNQSLQPEWSLLDASTNIADTVSYEDVDSDGTRDFTEDEDGDELFDSVTKYPEPLTRLFPGLTPRARMQGLTPIAGIPYLVNILVFDPGTDLPGYPLDPSAGYPSVVVLLDGGDPEPNPQPGAITDACSYFHTATMVLGLTQDNPETGDNEAGQVYRTNPGNSGSYPFGVFANSLPDAEDDGNENQLDTCPYSLNAGTPRSTNSGDFDGDGLDAACDPNDDPFSGGTNWDQDDDGYLNRQDNCPLVENGELTQINQADSDLDGIGNYCDVDPFNVDGHKHRDCLIYHVTIGGGGSLPPPPLLPCDSDNDGLPDTSDNCPTVPNPTGQAGDADGDLAGDACDAPGAGNVDCSGPASGVGSVDALKVLRHNAGLSVTQNEPCLDIGQPRALAPPDNRLMGDVDCSGGLNAVDALKILRAVAGLAVAKPPECPEVKPP